MVGQNRPLAFEYKFPTAHLVLDEHLGISTAFTSVMGVYAGNLITTIFWLCRGTRQDSRGATPFISLVGGGSPPSLD